VRHWFTVRKARSDLPPEVVKAVQGWMLEREVGELSLEPMGRYYAVRLNAAGEPVPGMFLPENSLQDAETLVELLQTALEVYYDEMNLDQ